MAQKGNEISASGGLWGQQSRPGHGGYEKSFHCCKAKYFSKKMWPFLQLLDKTLMLWAPWAFT